MSWVIESVGGGSLAKVGGSKKQCHQQCDLDHWMLHLQLGVRAAEPKRTEARCRERRLLQCWPPSGPMRATRVKGESADPDIRPQNKGSR